MSGVVAAWRYSGWQGSHFADYDLPPDVIDWARRSAEEDELTNMVFEVRDVTDLDRPASPAAFDRVTTFDAIHDQVRLLNVLMGIRRTLAPHGVCLAQDIRGTSHHHSDVDHPQGAMFYAVCCMHCLTVSLAQGGEGLGTM